MSLGGNTNTERRRHRLGVITIYYIIVYQCYPEQVGKKCTGQQGQGYQ